MARRRRIKDIPDVALRDVAPLMLAIGLVLVVGSVEVFVDDMFAGTKVACR